MVPSVCVASTATVEDGTKEIELTKHQLFYLVGRLSAVTAQAGHLHGEVLAVSMSVTAQAAFLGCPRCPPPAPSASES